VPSNEVLERLQQLHPKRIDLSLERIQRLLDKLGNPEQSLAPVVHVAGTNGKGSVTQYIRGALEATGKRVHTYTSPHLIRFHERIRIGQRASVSSLISEEELVSVLEEVERTNENDPITFFEITTAAAFLAFSRAPADVCILEVGLGGRLDATNVIPKTRLSVITPVSIDHVAFLGDDLGGIATEKAGILKKDVVAVIGPQEPAALAAIEKRAAEVGVKKLILHGRDWSVRRSEHEDDKIHVKVPTLTYERLPVPGLPGPHQLVNAGLAVTAIDQLGEFMIGHYAITEALRDVKWPGRLQRIDEGKIAKNFNQGTELWVDGAHNPGAAVALAETFAEWKKKSPKPLVLIAGMINTKDAVNFFKPLAPHVQALVTVDVPGQGASIPAKDLAAAAAKAGIKARAAKSLADAYEQAAAATDRGPPARVLFTGSLYLAGHILAADGRDLK
jgi:dihydrofolate synthase/folylpolyglutamate synthase